MDLLRAGKIGVILTVIIVLLSYVISGGSHPDFSDGVFSDINMKMYATTFLSGAAISLLMC